MSLTIDKCSDDELAQALLSDSLYAQASAKQKLRDLLREKHPMLSATQADELSERRFPSVWKKVVEISNNYLSMGVLPCVVPSKHVRHQIVGSGVVKTHDVGVIVKVRKRLDARFNVLKAVKSLTPRTFEKLCGFILLLYGCEEVMIGPKTHDKGIDFMGKMKWQTTSEYHGFMNSVKIRFLGQSKHQGTPASGEDARSFSEAVKAVLGGFRAYARVVGQEFLDSSEPLVPLFFSSGGFSPDAIRTLKRNCIIDHSLLQIVEDITWLGDSFFDDGGARSRFLEEKFVACLETLPRKKILHTKHVCD